MASIIVTGSHGQLGRALADAGKQHPEHRITGIDIDTLDLCHHAATEAWLHDHPADFLINCAAYTAVDQAEDEPENAMALNSEAVKNLALCCAKFNIRLIHISTDYIFKGDHPVPLNEEMPTGPESVYGQTKLEGEYNILYHATNAIILRTSWLYYHDSKNFVNAILRNSLIKESLQVVYDQTGSPTYAADLAESIYSIIGSPKPFEGIHHYHYANQGVTSWFDFARAILDLSGISTPVHPVRTATLNLKAPRPAFSVLDCSKIQRDYAIKIPYWRDSLEKHLQICHPKQP